MSYQISKQDNESHAFRADSPRTAQWNLLHGGIVADTSGAVRPGLRRCAACGELLAKWDESLAGLRLKKRRYDLSATYDGITVASQRFKELYESHSLTGLRFVQLPDDPKFYAVYATRTVNLDLAGAHTQFIKPCATCGRYESVIIPHLHLKEGTVIPDAGFVRTDLEFGSYDEKSPLILCGDWAGMVLKTGALKGLHLEELPE